MRPLPDLGFGVGLRDAHFDDVLGETPGVDFFEIITENFLHTRGRPRHVLDRVAERAPIVMHGVSLSIGGAGPLDRDYLASVKRLAAEIRPAWISDHLCWTGVAGRNTHDLLPLPFDDDTLSHVVEKIRVAQDLLGRRIVFENPSTYVGFNRSSMPEHEFVSRMAEAADCLLLLDVNNVHVSAFNCGFDAREYIAAIPPDRVAQIHVAGHAHHTTHLIDTHDAPVAGEVWSLYEFACQRIGSVATLLEWDDRIPPFGVLVTELEEARAHRRSSLANGIAA